MSKALDIEGLDTIEAVLPDFSLSLRARNRSPRTVQSYCEAAKLFDTYLTERGMPRNLRNIGREHVEAFIDDQLTRRSHASAAVRFRSLQQFFRWAKEDGQITVSPMANMSPPSVTAPPVPVVKDDHFRLLLKTCEGKTFEDYRDAAILSLLFDTGARLSEITNLRLADVDNGEMPEIRVMGKGRRARSVDYGVKTGRHFATTRRRDHCIRSQTSIGCGSAVAASNSRNRASLRCCAVVAARLASPNFTRTCSDTALLIRGSPAVARGRPDATRRLVVV